MSESHVQVVQMACGHIVTRALYAFAELGIADHLIDGPVVVEMVIPPGNDFHVGKLTDVVMPARN